ncbi:unnamed protein product [Dibothriocephalus latus]|uniref:Ig-like domain-containing protein n=1 Tax=Dibothriocephalus latus TaxID=60516 RepID=A0A3P7L2J6_DIBLA|nr:unnamed protein product [Dibothriocephalus latus]
MRVIEAAVEARKVQILQQDTWESSAKTYSFPVDSHLTQLTVQVTNYKTQDPIKVNIRNPEGKLMTKDDRLRQLMKTVPTVFVASIDQPMPGREDDSLQWHSVRVSGVSEVDFVPGFATTQLPHNVGSSRQPIEGEYVGTEVHTCISLHTMLVTGRDGQGYNFQRYSKVALIARKARPVVVSCPAKIEVARGATAAITCLVDSEIPFKVNWYQSGHQLTGFPGEHQTYR